ncbi:MAG: efflux RND transporter periplasmic adaptor subunit [Pseudomonadota bacterium]
MRVLAITAGLLAGLLFAGSTVAETHARLVGGDERVLGVPVSGVIESVEVAVGDRVETGDELLRLDATVFEARLAAARAEEESTRLERDEARAELERTRTLFDRNQIAENELKLAENAAARAEADHQAARAERIQRAWRLERGHLRAPVDGTITAVAAFPGQTVVARQAAPQLMRMRADGELRAEAHLPLDSATSLGRGDSVTVSRDGGQVGARVVGGERIDGFWRVSLVLDEVPADWQSGQTVRVETE